MDAAGKPRPTSRHTRRRLLRTLGAATTGGGLAGLAGCAGLTTAPPEEDGAVDPTPSTDRTGTPETETGTPTATPGQTTRTYAISEGTDQETTLHEIASTREGPTFLLVGGVHGDELSGWKTADAVVDWTVDAGTLLVLPRANPGAVRRRTRSYPEGVDLNRQFPKGKPPETSHARNIWRALRRHDPDVVVDLHSSLGILAEEEGYVGQNVFHSTHPRMTDRMAEATAYLTREHVPDERLPTYEFLTTPMETDLQMLTNKARQDLGLPVALFEVTRKGLDAETQVAWTTAFVEKTLDLWGIRRIDRG